MEGDETLFSNAQQVKNMLAQAGIALGITFATLGQQWRAAVHFAALNGNVAADNPAFTASAQNLVAALATRVEAPLANQMAVAQVALLLQQQAALLANIDHFVAVAALGVLGVLITLGQRVFR
jgi:hypothetical protein